MDCWVLAGPTAAGKTAVALELAALAPVEIISCDSMQVYRGMDIGTAKPTPEERARVPHHLIDVVEAWEDFSVGRYVELASAAIASVEARGRRPLVVGGSSLYLKALFWGLFEGPPRDEAVRAELRAEAEARGVEALHARLAEVDPETAAWVHARDELRIIRALEVFRLTGRPISAYQQQFKGEPSRPCRMVGLSWPRAALYERIDARVAQMVREGFVEEVRAILARGGLGPQARQAVGYRHIAACLAGRCSLAEAVSETQKASRRLAKHQWTWLKHFPGIRWVECGPDRPARQVAEEALELLSKTP